MFYIKKHSKYYNNLKVYANLIKYYTLNSNNCLLYYYYYIKMIYLSFNVIVIHYIYTIVCMCIF